MPEEHLEPVIFVSAPTFTELTKLLTHNKKYGYTCFGMCESLLNGEPVFTVGMELREQETK